MAAPEEESELEQTRMSLGDHLEELRSRLVKGLLAVAVAFAVGWFFQEEIQSVVLAPLNRALAGLREAHLEEARAYVDEHPEDWERYFSSPDPATRQLVRDIDTRPMATGVAEGVFFTIRIVFYFALFLGAPVLLWQMWQFVAAGLYRKERKVVVGYFPYSVGLFLTGVAFGYFVLVPFAMQYLIGFVDIEMVRPEIKLSEYFTMLFALSLAIGGVFQLPLVMVVTVRLGILEPSVFSRWRGYFVLGAFVFSAMITPPDPFTQLMMAVPTIVLYEIGLIASRFVKRKADEPSMEIEPA